MDRLAACLALLFCCGASALAPPALPQTLAAPAQSVSRQPSAVEERQIASALRAILFYTDKGVPELQIEETAKISPLIAQTLGPAHPVALQLALVNAESHTLIGKFADAEARFLPLIPQMERESSLDRRVLTRARASRAANLVYLGRLAEAEAIFQANREAAEKDPQATALTRAAAQADMAYLRRTQGRFAAAEELGRTVLAAREAGLQKDDPAIAIARSALARSLIGLGRIEEAEALARQGLEGYPREDTGKARLLYALGEAQAELGRANDAKASFRAAALLLVKTQGYKAPDTIRAAAMSRLQEMSFTGLPAANDFDIPASPMLSCPKQYQGDSDVDAALVDAAYIPLTSEQAKCLDAAQSYVDAAIGPDAPLSLLVRERLADALDRAGDTDRAEAEAQKLLAGREKVNGPDHPATQRAAVIYGRILGAQGRSDAATGLLARARGAAGVEAQLVAARQLDARGYHSQAGPAWEAAMAAGLKLPQPSLPMMIDGFAGYVFNQALLGQCPKELLPTLAPMAENPMLGSNNVGIAAREAHAILLACTGEWQKADSIYSFAQFQSGSGLAFQEQQRALLQARRAIVFSRNPRYLENASSQAGEAMLIARERRFTPDRDANNKPLGFRRSRRGTGTDPLALAFAAGVTVAWAKHQSLPKGGDALAPLFVADEAFRAAQDFGLSQAAASLLQSAARRAVTDPGLGHLIDSQVAVAGRLDETERTLLASGKPADAATTSRAEADRKELTALTDQLRQRYPAYAEASRPFGLPIAELRRRLKPDEAVLLIQPVGEDIYSFAVSPESQAWNKAAPGRQEVDRLVTLVRCRIDRDNCPVALPNDQLFDPQVANQLYAALIKPVLPGIGNAQTLYTVTSGSLSGIPLGLLVTDHDAASQPADELAGLAALPWLAKRYALAALPSVSSLRAYDSVKTQHIAAFAGVGDPVLGAPVTNTRGMKAPRIAGTRGSGGFANIAEIKALASLPGTRRELIAIATSLGTGEGQLKLGTQAREGEIKLWPLLQQARVVAFATHAMLPNELAGSEEPGLVLTPPATASASDDGYLSATEAAQLRLSADWVILSACNTAGPDGRPGGESLSGLGRAFLFAGVRSLLASHWPVDDTVGAAITSETFRILAATPDISRAEAYRRALQGIRTGTSALSGAIEGWKPAWADPWAWAPFTLIESGS